MSCGKFVCGMRKFDQHKQFAADKPSNPAHFEEQQKKLQDLIRLREQQDAGQTYLAIPNPPPPPPSPEITSMASPAIQYTPWKTPTSLVLPVKR